jgi:hypothetical protein
MSSKLAINVEDLLRQRKVGGDRVEYKKGWNPDPIMRTSTPLPMNLKTSAAISSTIWISPRVVPPGSQRF